MNERDMILREWEAKRRPQPFSSHRLNEWMSLLGFIKPQPGHRVVSLENNPLAVPVAERIGEKGSLVSFDYSFTRMRALVAKGCRAELLNIEPILLERSALRSKTLPLNNNFADTVYSLPRVPFRRMRFESLPELYRILKPGGRLVFQSIHPDSASENFHRATQPKKHHRTGPSKEEFVKVASDIGFSLRTWQTRETPWIFSSPKSMVNYLQKIQPSPFSSRHVKEAASRYLGFERFDAYTILRWSSLFVVLEK